MTKAGDPNYNIYNHMLFGQGNTAFGQPNNAGGGGLFSNQATPQSNVFGGGQQQQQGGNLFGSQNQQGAGLFGGAGNTMAQPTQSNSLFGGNAGNTGGGGLFGNAQPQNTFGNTGGSIFGGATNQAQPSAFGNTSTVFGGGLNTQPQTQGAGLFGNTQQNQPTNTGLFGGANTAGTGFGANNNSSGGLFGNNAQTTQSPFGGNAIPALGSNQNTNTGGSIFGGGQNMGQPTGGNVFGGGFGNNNNNQGKSLFGGGNTNTAGNMFGGAANNTFGGNNTNQTSGGIFGGGGTTNTQFGGNPTGGSIFGGTSNNTNTGFNMNTTTQGQGLFGNNASTAPAFGSSPSNIFSNTNPAGNSGGSLFGGQQTNSQVAAFGTANTNNANAFSAGKSGLFGGATTTATTGFSFGTSATPSFGSINPNPSTNNSFGNTSWGVPTANTGNTQLTKFTPLKPKNTKIDGKHMVKCVTLLDENMNFCKNELRIRYIMTGGASNPVQLGQTMAFGQGTPANTGNLFGGAGTTTPMFGGQNTFQNNQQPAVGGGLFGNTGNTATGGLFGNSNAQQQQQQQQAPLFGFNNNTTGNNNGGGGLFGNTNTNNTFKTPTLFGGAATTTPTVGGGLFGNTGAAQPATGGGLFGNNTAQPATGGLFGGGVNATGGVFGAKPNQPTQPQTGLFGGPATQNPTPALGTFQTGATGGLFGGQTAAQPTAGLFGGGQAAPTQGLTTQTAPLFGQFGQQQQQQQGMLGVQQSAGGTMGAATQPQWNPQMMPPMMNPMYNPYFPQASVPYGNLELAALLFNGALNPDIIKNLMKKTQTPYEELLNRAKSRNADYNNYNDDSVSWASQENRRGQNEDDFSVGLSPRFNMYNKNMTRSTINFRHTPRLITDFNSDQFERSRQAEEIRAKFSRKKEILEPRPMRAVPAPRERLMPERFAQSVAEMAGISKFSSIQSSTNSKLKSKFATKEQLPTIDDDYTITPSLDQLKLQTSDQLKSVYNVVIENEHGKIKFKQPVNLHGKKISECIKIEQNSIDILEPSWQDIKSELFFYNFGDYQNLKSPEEKAKMEKKIKRWVEKNSMIERNFNKNTGELQVQIN